MLLFLLPQKMAVPLLLVSEHLLSILYKGTSVVVEEGLLDIHFQPATSQLLLKPLGSCCLAFSGLNQHICLRYLFYSLTICLEK